MKLHNFMIKHVGVEALGVYSKHLLLTRFGIPCNSLAHDQKQYYVDLVSLHAT